MNVEKRRNSKLKNQLDLAGLVKACSYNQPRSRIQQQEFAKRNLLDEYKSCQINRLVELEHSLTSTVRARYATGILVKENKRSTPRGTPNVFGTKPTGTDICIRADTLLSRNKRIPNTDTDTRRGYRPVRTRNRERDDRLRATCRDFPALLAPLRCR